jgi:hypothetical protein
VPEIIRAITLSTLRAGRLPHAVQGNHRDRHDWAKQVQNDAMLAFLSSLDPLRTASVCTGALVLGAGRLLNGRAASTRRQALGEETELSQAEVAAIAHGHCITAHKFDEWNNPVMAGDRATAR